MSGTQLEGYPCTPQQAFVWRLMAPGASDRYLARVTAVIDGCGDAGRVRAALERLVARHEVLRTRFQMLPGMTVPLQVVGNAEIDWTTGGAPPAGGPGADGPALRASAVPLQGDRLRLTLTAPALCADAESLVRILEELAFELSGQSVDDSGVLQYADYGGWRRDLLTADENAELRRYWEEVARGAAPPSVTETPAAAVARAAAASAATRLAIRHPEDVGTLVGGIARTTGAGEAAVLLAAWAVAVARSRGTRDVVLEHRFDGRAADPLRGAVGRYAQHLPVRVSWQAGARFQDLARAVDAELRMAAERQDYADPDAAAPAGDGGPRSGVGFALVEATPAIASGPVTITVESLAVEESDLPLALTCQRHAQGCSLTFDADRRQYDETELRRLADRTATLLQSAAARPDAAVDELNLLPTAERNLLVTLAGTDDSVTAAATLDELVERQARETPQRVAVRGAESTLTYGELDARANQLASYLAQKRIGRGDVVALALPRTPDVLVAILAVLKTGAAYLPLDPASPPRRLARAIEAARARLVVASGNLASGLPADLERVRLDEERAAIERHSTDRPPAASSLDALAYVLFTSGSTGQPNGVAVPHRAVVNYLTWCAEAYELRAGQGAVVATPLGFDLTVTALLGPLVAGQSVVLVPEDGGLEALAAALKSGVDYTLLKITPSQLRALRPLLAGTPLEGRVRVLVLGGEALTAEMIDDFRDHAPGTAIVNEYGPTETTVGCCAHRITADDRTGPVPIGRPIANTRLYVLDEAGELAPFGAPGELYVAGAGVADGYLHQPARTGERFIDDPFAPGRMYRTGDRVRYRPDGALEFLGRTDEEMKFHGVRIHPLEIESALDEHPAVASSIVAVRDDLRGNARLVAYVVPRGKAGDIVSDDLRRHLLERLPEAMVPGLFLPIAAIPLTAHGKRDRAALPAIDAGPARPPYVAPRTHEESVLAAVWASVFGCDQVGIDDNYFVLGGDSLRSVQVTALAQKRGVTLSVADIHRHPTIRELAAAARDKDPQEAPAAERFSLISEDDRRRMTDDIEDAYPLNLLQEGMIYHREFAPKSAVYHAICSYRIRAPFDGELMRTVIDQLIARHPLLRTSFDLTTYSRPLQLVHRRVPTPFTIEDVRDQSPEAHEAAVDGWMEHEKRRGFDLNECPLIRYRVHRLTDDVFQLTYSFHHEIIDGWSDAYMVTELLTHYFSVLYGQPFDAVAPTTRFRDAIVLEQRALETDAFREFWKQNLEDAQVMKLPQLVRRPKRDKGEREIVKIEVPVPEALSDAVKRLAAALAVPVKTVLLAAHQRVMAEFGGVSDVLTYTVSNGRPENRDGHSVIGLFVNSLAFRMKLSGGTWTDLILDTLRTEHELLPYRRYPMAELKRQSGNEPLSETLFFFNHYHVADVLQQWEGPELLGIKVYGESTFPYCINAYLTPITKRLGMRIEYDSLQYAATVIDAMSDSYVDVLSAMVESPEARYEAIPHRRLRTRALLGAAREHAARPAAEYAGIHRFAEAAAAASPDRLALVAGHEQITHRTLHERANGLAHYLRELGVGPDDRVGLCLDASPALVTALLAVLKAGGAYVPLDPAHPAERIRYIVEDAGLKLVLTSRAHGDLFATTERRLLLVDELWSDIPLVERPPAGDEPDALAYVIYTSGSTGQPKGVLVTHRSLVNATRARIEYYADPVDRFLMLSPFTFDSSAAGLYWALCGGGTLVLPTEGRPVDLTTLARLTVDHEVTHTLTIPSLYAAFLQQGTPLSSIPLRTLIMAGEECPQSLYECHRHTAPSVALFNEYGPTEATIWSTVAPAAPRELGTLVPIGSPIANTRAYVLDAYFQPAPIGVAGELYVAGAGLARGYAGRSDLTADRFMPDPFAPERGGRMYRTGDLVRCLPDGALEFINRVDSQVKINGFRIEAAEIERVLDLHPNVSRSIVLAREDEPGQKRLVAYVLPREKQRPTAHELGQYVRERLPKYLVPSAYVLLDTLPVTSTGKVDRRALPPAAPGARADLGTGFVAPRTATEEVVAGIWRDVLGVPAVGVFDDFFDLGGESLRAMRVVSRVRSVFQVPLPLGTMTTSGVTVARLAEEVEAAIWAAAAPVGGPPAVADGQYEVGSIQQAP